MTIKNPALQYYGGKWRIASWIIENLPPHTCYVEPFGGAASVLLQKKPSDIEVYNDLNNDVVTFFRVLRDNPDALVRAIELTPFSRYEYVHAWDDTDDEIEKARRVAVRYWQGRVPRPDRNGWKFQRLSCGDNAKKWHSMPNNLLHVAKRLKRVFVENDTAENVIKRYDADTTCFYVDPPYVHETRAGTNVYAYEMDIAAHEQLAILLHGVSGAVVLSGYDSDLYRDLYPGWLIVTNQTKDIKHNAQTEVLWINREPVHKQLSMFSTVAHDGE